MTLTQLMTLTFLYFASLHLNRKIKCMRTSSGTWWPEDGFTKADPTTAAKDKEVRSRWAPLTLSRKRDNVRSPTLLQCGWSHCTQCKAMSLEGGRTGWEENLLFLLQPQLDPSKDIKFTFPLLTTSQNCISTALKQ